MTNFTRRGFMASAAAACATLQYPVPARAAAQGAALLSAASRTIEVDGHAASVWGLVRPGGGPGLILDPGQRFRVDLTNALDVPTIVHWHGQIPPNAQDGVPDLPLPLLAPGEVRAFDFEPLPGTHWMHSHVPEQEMRLLAAPLIVRSAEDVAADRQEVVMFLHDFAFKTPEEVLAEITGGTASAHDGHGAAAPADGMDQSAMGHDMSGMGGMSGMGEMSGMGSMAMDLNDYDWDAYLANDRTLADPEVVSVERGGRVRLRIINAAAATVFWIDTGALKGRLVAVDGHGVMPLDGSRFGLAMGQRLDIELDLPGAGAWPILALREGARERTGLILASTGATVNRIDALGSEAAPAFDTDLAQEARLLARDPLAGRPADRKRMLMLGGGMSPYLWTIDGATWGNHAPVEVSSGERLELAFHNMSMMGHPMHLHGHSFQVVEINGRRLSGALRDTVYVPPMAMVTVALDAGEAARWMLHCHHMPHLATGMMTELAVAPAA
ncbi:MAG: multicopper oxidase domain-containing protein [Proteobacteria bacterium]|nr:multicopper oxidase domain-containing protein [Pseudomonadota bacterium]